MFRDGYYLEGDKGNFLGYGNLYLDVDDGDTSVHVCQNSPSIHLKLTYFTVLCVYVGVYIYTHTYIIINLKIVL